MKITIINGERTEKRYTRIELEEFVEQLKDGTYRDDHSMRDARKENNLFCYQGNTPFYRITCL